MRTFEVHCMDILIIPSWNNIKYYIITLLSWRKWVRAMKCQIQADAINYTMLCSLPCWWNFISPYKNTQSVVIIISYVPILGRSSTVLTYAPAMRTFATIGFSWPQGSAPSWLPPPPLRSSSASLPAPTLKPPVPPFPSTARSQALAFNYKWKREEGSPEAPPLPRQPPPRKAELASKYNSTKATYNIFPLLSN